MLKRKMFIQVTLLVLLFLCILVLSSWAACPEDTSDLGE
jgi:hypothetical protein